MILERDSQAMLAQLEVTAGGHSRKATVMQEGAGGRGGHAVGQNEIVTLKPVRLQAFWTYVRNYRGI